MRVNPDCHAFETRRNCWSSGIASRRTLPTFLSPHVVQVLTDRFGLCGVGNAESDGKSITG